MVGEIEKVKDRIIAFVRERSGEFLDANADAKAFLEERAKRLAELTLQMATVGSDESARTSVKRDIAIVQQSMENEMARIAVQAEAEARSTFLGALNMIADYAKEILPALSKLII